MNNTDKVFSVKVQPLADDVSKQVLQQAFRVFGDVISVAIKSGANHKYGYVNFRNAESALRAVQHHQVDVCGRPSFITHQQNPNFPPPPPPPQSTDGTQPRDKQKQRDMDQLKSHFSRKATVQQIAACYAKNQFDVDRTWEELLEENTGSESHGIPRVRYFVQGAPLKLMDESKTVIDSRGYKLFDPHDWNAFEGALRRTVVGFLNGGGGRLILGLNSHGDVAGLQPSPPDKKGRDRIRQCIDAIFAKVDPPGELSELRFTVRFVPVHKLDDETLAIPNTFVLLVSVAEIPSETLDNSVGVYFTDATRTEAFQRVNRIVQRMDADFVKRRISKVNTRRKERGQNQLAVEPQPGAPVGVGVALPVAAPMPPSPAALVVEVPTVSVGVPPVVPSVLTQLVPVIQAAPPAVPVPMAVPVGQPELLETMYPMYQLMPQTQAAIAAAPRQVVLAEHLEAQLQIQQQVKQQQQLQIDLQRLQQRIALDNAMNVNDLEAKLLQQQDAGSPAQPASGRGAFGGGRGGGRGRAGGRSPPVPQAPVSPSAGRGSRWVPKA